MDNTELFLDKYKELENAAINEFKLPPDGSAVAKLEKRSEFKDIRFELNYCREVRNLLQHNQRLDEEFAVQPGKKMIELLDMVLDRIKNPVRCMDIAVPFNDLVWRSLDDPVMPVIRIMNDRNISHVPILKDKRVYFTVILRMFIIPVICTLVMYLIHARGMVAVITIILEACPCAAITTLFAIKFGHDQKLAVGAVTLSTLISIITLPCLALLAGEIIM